MKERASEISRILAVSYPDTRSYLDHETPFQLMIAVILSAQTTDAAVNRISPELFRRWPDAESLSLADVSEVEDVIRSIGLYKTKAARIRQCAATLLADFAGVVPETVPDLMRLPGVGRKSANVISNSAFGNVEGVAVDTHVFRIAHRLGLSAGKTADAVERDLLEVFDESDWEFINHRWIALGRAICKAGVPLCGECPINRLCPHVP